MFRYGSLQLKIVMTMAIMKKKVKHVFLKSDSYLCAHGFF